MTTSSALTRRRTGAGRVAGTAAPARQPRDFLMTLCPEEVKRNGCWRCSFSFSRLNVKETPLVLPSKGSRCICKAHPSTDHVCRKLSLTGYKTKNAFTIITQLDGEITSMTLASGSVWWAGEGERKHISPSMVWLVCVGCVVLFSRFVLFG